MLLDSTPHSLLPPSIMAEVAAMAAVVAYARASFVSLARAAEAGTARLAAPFEPYLAAFLPEGLGVPQGAATRLAPRFFLVSCLLFVGVYLTRFLLWYVKTKRRLDDLRRESPDDILADRELRALRRGLLMVDVKRHIPRLLRKIRQLRAGSRIAKAGMQERGDGMVALHAPLGHGGGIAPRDAAAALASPGALGVALRSTTSQVAAQNIALAARAVEAAQAKAATQAAAAAAAATQASTAPRGTAAAPPGPESNSESEATLRVLHLLRRHTLFKYVDPDLLVTLAREAREVSLNAGEELFTFGTDVRTPSLYIVKSGAIETYVRVPDRGSGGALSSNDAAAAAASAYPDNLRRPALKCIGRLESGDTLSALLDLLSTLCALPIVCQVSAVAVPPVARHRGGGGGERDPERAEDAAACCTVVYKWDQGLLQRMGEEHPVSIGRLIRMIMVKLNRATFSTMYQYLGLTTELTLADAAAAAAPTASRRQCVIALQDRAGLIAKCTAVASRLFDIPEADVPEVVVPRGMSFDPGNDDGIVDDDARDGDEYTTERRRQRGPGPRIDIPAAGGGGGGGGGGVGVGHGVRELSPASQMHRVSSFDFDPVLRAAGTSKSGLAESLIRRKKSRGMSGGDAPATPPSSSSKSGAQKHRSLPKDPRGRHAAAHTLSPSFSSMSRSWSTPSFSHMVAQGTAGDSTATALGARGSFVVLEPPEPESLEVIDVLADDVLASPGDAPCLFIVLAGTLDVSMRRPGAAPFAASAAASVSSSSSPKSSVRLRRQMGRRRASVRARASGMSGDGHQRQLFSVNSGGLVGLLPLQTGEAWNMQVRAITDAIVVRVSRTAYAAVVRSHPRVVFHAASLLCSRLSPLLRMIDYGLRWRHMKPGELLVREGAPCEALHVVLHGRLREMVSSSSTSHRAFHARGFFDVEASLTAACTVAGGKHMIVGRGGENEGEGDRDTGGRNGDHGLDEEHDEEQLGSQVTVEEYGRGSCVGESEILARAPHAASVCAIRDTEVVELSRELFHLIADACPGVLPHVTRNVSAKLMARARRDRGGGRGGGGGGYSRVMGAVGGAGAGKTTSRNNISTIAVLPITDHADPDYLVSALSCYLKNGAGAEGYYHTSGGMKRSGGSVATVSSARIAEDLGIDVRRSSPLDAHDTFTVMSYLSQLEEMHRVVMYQCDGLHDAWPSDWTATCLRQADIVLLVGHAADAPDVTDFERWAIQHLSYAQNVLVLLHDMDLVARTEANLRRARKQRRQQTFSSSSSTARYKEAEEDREREDTEAYGFWTGYRPRNTREWIRLRAGRRLAGRGNTGIQHHLHVRIYPEEAKGCDHPSLSFDATSPLSDVARLARWLMGTQVGLTLGGGGARGLAHVGTYEALVARGVPVDVVGGTSQGSFIGALIAMVHNPRDMAETRRQLVRLSRLFAREMSSNWAKIRDLTIPYTSYFNGSVFNEGIMRHFGDIRIEDLWLDYFCISTDLTDMREIVHRNGMLWRYVRASMSLGPYLPPMCELWPTSTAGKGADNGGKGGGGSNDGNDSSSTVHYLVDGGYVNNLPADEMRRLQAPLAVIAVDVSSYLGFAGTDYGDSVSGFRQCFDRWSCCLWPGRCFRRRRSVWSKIPGMSSIASQLAYVANHRQLPDRVRHDIDLYLKPGVGAYGTLEFDKFGAIRDIGFKHARRSLAAWEEHLEEEGDPLLGHVFVQPRASVDWQREGRRAPPRRPSSARKKGEAGGGGKDEADFESFRKKYRSFRRGAAAGAKGEVSQFND